MKIRKNLLFEKVENNSSHSNLKVAATKKLQQLVVAHNQIKKEKEKVAQRDVCHFKKLSIIIFIPNKFSD